VGAGLLILSSLALHLHQVGQGTFTPKLPNMPGTQGKGAGRGPRPGSLDYLVTRSLDRRPARRAVGVVGVREALAVARRGEALEDGAGRVPRGVPAPAEAVRGPGRARRRERPLRRAPGSCLRDGLDAEAGGDHEVGFTSSGRRRNPPSPAGRPAGSVAAGSMTRLAISTNGWGVHSGVDFGYHRQAPGPPGCVCSTPGRSGLPTKRRRRAS